MDMHVVIYVFKGNIHQIINILERKEPVRPRVWCKNYENRLRNLKVFGFECLEKVIMAAAISVS